MSIHPDRALLAAALLLLPLPLAGCAQDSGEDDAAAAETQQLGAAATRLDARAPSPGADDAAALEADVRARLAAEQR